MAFNPNITYQFLMAVEQLTPPTSFLRDRYFPSSENDIFLSTKVLAEFRDGNKKIAPVVAPRIGGKTIQRQGSVLKEYEPPLVAPKRNTSIDDIKERGFGESILPTLTPEERASQLALRDAMELDELITRREEQIAAELLQNNGYILRPLTDDDEIYDEFEMFFYDGINNPGLYTVNIPWDAAGGSPMKDFEAMILMLRSRGLPASELLVAGDVADAIMEDEAIYRKLLVPDGKYDIGRINPAELPEGAAHIATLNVKGRNIDILTYEETYEDDNGDDVPYILPGTAIMLAPNIGRTLYGAVTQMEQADNEFHTYGGRRIPKIHADSDKNVRDMTLSSKPLLMPIQKTPFITAKNVLQ